MFRGGGCSTSTIRGNTSTLVCLSDKGCSILVLSIVVPILSNVATLGGLHRRNGRVPMLVLATGTRVSSGILKLSDNTGCCLAGPFSAGRLLTTVHTVAEHRARARGGVSLNGVALSESAFRVSSPAKDFQLTGGRFRVVRVLVSCPRRVFPTRHFVRGV